MSLIKNLVKEQEFKSSAKKSKRGSENDSEDEKKLRPVIKSALDLQRLKLEKLMKNPDKPVIIPEHRKEKDFMQSVPSFVRNVMGSSAGAGSGEFHVYRHLRRKEYARQKMIQSKSHQEQLDDDYQQKLEDNRKIAEEKTAKKRAKRLKKKQRAKKQREKESSNDNSNDSFSTADEQNSNIQKISAGTNDDKNNTENCCKKNNDCNSKKNYLDESRESNDEFERKSYERQISDETDNK